MAANPTETAQKRLTRIRLVNWHLFADTTISVQGTTYFIGINGAGKSTILDAIQFALVGGQRDVRFNQAALAGGKRSLAAYVRGELGTEGQRFLRGDATGVVALEFVNPDGTSFVHGAVIDAFEDGRSPEIMYFIVHNAALDDDWFWQREARGARPYDTRAFKRHLEHFAWPRGARAQVFTRVEDYRLHLLNRLGQLRESFLAKIVKGLAFTPLTDIRGFVHNYLLDENLVDVKNLQAQLETLRHFEALAADVRERIAALTRIEELDLERAANRRRRVTNGFVRRRAQADAHLTALKQRRLELDELRLSLSRSALRREALADELRRAQSALVEAQVALQTDTVAARERELRAQIEARDAEVKALREQAARVSAALAREAESAGRLRALLAADGQPPQPGLEAFLAAATRLADAGAGDALAGGADELPAALGALQAELEEWGRYFAGRAALLAEQTRGRQAEAAELRRELTQLRAGNREASFEAEAPAAMRLRQLLQRELGLAPHDVLFLCAALDITDEAWQDAVEGVLGADRFSLLVPPAHYAAAVRLYRERHEAEQLAGAAVLDVQRLTQAGVVPAASGTLAAEVRAAHPAAQAFLNLALGPYVKCPTVEALRAQRTGVTPDCFVRRDHSTSHLDPRHFGQWFIGARALPRRIAQREARLAELEQELMRLEAQAADLTQRLALTRDRARPLVELEHALPPLARLPEALRQLRSWRHELGRLDRQSVEVLRAEVLRCQGEQGRWQDEARQLDQQTGAWEAQARALEADVIPRLETDAAAAADSAEAFVAAQGPAEPAAELRAEVEHEYVRRRERQPLDTVLTNAARYEGDYETAESRNRDRLREAKQAYSLKVDFGYDEREDAGRYLDERDKFIRSELPQYESRIAEQRALAEQELVENFIHRLREQVEEARQQLDYLNATLRDLRFGGERFEFITRPAPLARPVYELIMDSQSVLGASLFESDFRQRHQTGWDLLFERLTARGGDPAAPNDELRQLQDYRNYLEYDIRIHYANGDRALLSQINAKKSGGETTTPFYVAMAASFAQAYRLNQPRPTDTIRLALFDEAFSKMDTARTASALQFMRDIGLQVLLATPPDKSGALLPFVDAVRTVVRKDGYSFVVEIDKAELLEELERAAEHPAAAARARRAAEHV